jgi:hypothetical protein
MSTSRSTIVPLAKLADTPRADTGNAVILTEDELTYFHATRYVLRNHKSLQDTDVGFAANYTASLRAANLYQNFDDDQFAMFLAYADTTGVGKFAFTFNEELDQAVLDRNIPRLRDLLLGPTEMFVEIYDNPYLTDEDREFAVRMLARSIYAHQLLLEQLRQKDTINDECPVVSMLTEETATPNGVSAVALANRCYEEVCIQEAQILHDDPVRTQMNTRDKPPAQVYTIDRAPSKHTPQVYCFETIELLAAVTQDPPMNPKSGEPFSPQALNLITTKFRRELAMYRRYQQS